MEIPKTEYRKGYLKRFDELMRRPKYVERECICDDILKECFPSYYEFVRVSKGLYLWHDKFIDMANERVYVRKYSEEQLPPSLAYDNCGDRYPKRYDMKGIDSIAYVFSEIEPWNMKRLRAYNVSEVTDFTGTFSNTPELNSLYIKDWNVSNGLYFVKMFFDSSDKHGFKYLRNWDCSKGLSYRGMLNNNCEIDYAAVSRMRVNPNANFSYMFDKIPKQEVENFRNWFPDMDIDKIRNKLMYNCF